MRSVTIEIINRSGFPLTLSRVEKCWGVWTAPPPHSIPNNGTATINADSAGTAAGTTGVFEYQFQPRTGYAPETPFAGIYGRRTGLNAGLTRTDNCLVACSSGITPKETRESAYDNIPMDFELVRATDTQSGGGTEFTELAFHALSAAAGGWGFSIVGTYRIVEHPAFHLTLQPTNSTTNVAAIPEFEPYRTTRLRPLGGVSSDFWMDTWRAVAPDGKTIKVDIVVQANGTFQASARDDVLAESFTAASPGLQLRQQVADEYSADSWVPLPLLPAQPIIHPPHSRNDHARVNRPPHLGNIDDAPMVNHQQLSPHSKIRLPVVDTMVMGERCYVQSYGEFDGATQVGKRLRYVRFSGMYAPVCDVMLSNRLDIR